jgi:hypothetical protein
MPKGRRCITAADYPMHPALFHQVGDNGGDAGDLVVGRHFAVAAVVLAHRLNRQASALGHLLASDVAGQRRGLLHAEIDQDRLVAAAADQVLDEDDVLAASI